ncbi:MAG TPA: hypothetical protein VM735_12580 [Candidatus Kapabacteria bacterium]|nr:hypothetical protein [Candidatus Kapabacteria bacterium]
MHAYNSRESLVITNSSIASIQNVMVEVDVSSLERSSTGSVTGVVFIRAGDVSFPEVRWSDFPVVSMSWWLEPVSRILVGKSRVWECRFMDGPFTARLEQQHGDTWALSLIHSGRVEFVATVSCRAFISSLLDARVRS